MRGPVVPFETPGLLVPPPAGRVRTALRWLIGAWVAAELLIPLRYYLGSDRYDERFSWRMFSAVRLERCSLALDEWALRHGAVHVERVDPAGVVPVTWVVLLQRNREAVTARFLRWRCGQEGMQRVRLVNSCVDTQGRPRPPVERDVDCREALS